MLNKIGMLLLEGIQVIGISAILIVILNVFLITPQEVKGLSMYPYLNNGDRLITEKVSYKFEEPKRGDIIVFHFPLDKTQDYIKRIVALPEEKIQLKDNKVVIYNEEHPEGIVLDEEYVNGDTKARNFIEEGEIIEIPEDKYVVFGDNREKSSDSRQWGFIEREDIVGKAFLKYWPPENFGLVE